MAVVCFCKTGANMTLIDHAGVLEDSVHMSEEFKKEVRSLSLFDFIQFLLCVYFIVECVFGLFIQP